MLDKLRIADARYDEINNKLADPTVISDNNLYKELMKEFKNLTPLIETYRLYQKAEHDFKDAQNALDEAGADEELREMASIKNVWKP